MNAEATTRWPTPVVLVYRVLRRLPVLRGILARVRELVEAEARCRRLEEKHRHRIQRAKDKQRRRERHLKRRIRMLEAECCKTGLIELHRYGSYSRGHAGWQERWDQSKGRRVLFCAVKDHAGSFFKWAEATNRHTRYAARLAVFSVHEYGYANDLVLPHPDFHDRTDDLARLVSEADIIHIKTEEGPFVEPCYRVPETVLESGKPRIFTAYGGYFRRLESLDEFRRYVASFDAAVAMTPDLICEWFDARFIPHAIDVDASAYLWRDGRRLAHSPSNKARKATNDLLAAIRDLDVDFDMIHGVDHATCLSRKRRANLFFDQAGRENIVLDSSRTIDTIIGWYGNAALEAAVHGIPTIAHLSARAFDGARRAGRDIEADCAIINTPLGAEGIRETLARYFALSPEDRTALSRRTRRWVEDFHSYQSCARELERLYDEILGHKPSVESGSGARLAQCGGEDIGDDAARPGEDPARMGVSAFPRGFRRCRGNTRARATSGRSTTWSPGCGG